MVTSTAEQSAALAINHGCDLNCGSTYLYVQKACEDGLVSEEKITEAAVRLLPPGIFWGFLTRRSLISFLIWRWSPKSIWLWQKKRRQRALFY
ncbi:MAG: hypothetical protein ACLR2E_21000 [Lachnospiraceae bacterium]